jgi:hypothetical protein
MSPSTPGTVSPFDWPSVPQWQPATIAAATTPTPPPDELWAQTIYNGQTPAVTMHKKTEPPKEK